jgi:hypothetical protein
MYLSHRVLNNFQLVTELEGKRKIMSASHIFNNHNAFITSLIVKGTSQGDLMCAIVLL